MIHSAEVLLRPGRAVLTVDGKEMDAAVSVTFKRDGSLSTLRVGRVRIPPRCSCSHTLEDHGHDRGRCLIEVDRYELCACEAYSAWEALPDD